MSNSTSGTGHQAFNVYTNPYKAQRTWPPDFSKMDSKDQFRLERRFRRRSKLAYTRPRWIKAVKLAQYGSIMGVLVYGVLFMDWGTMHQPFDSVRRWVREKSSLIWTVSTTQPPRPSLGRISDQPLKEYRSANRPNDP